MKRLSALIVLMIVATIITVARSGHELPVYPSYYPHEIEIQAIAPDRAAALLREGKIQAYVASKPVFVGTVPDSIRAVESLGSFMVVRVSPQSPLAKDEQSACNIAKAIISQMAGHGVIVHPYPVTPFHGDYLYHVDLAEAAKARFSGGSTDSSSLPSLKVKTVGELARNAVRPDWYTSDSEWDAEVTAVSAADLVASSMLAVNGWLGPAWLRKGWFHAELLLAGSTGDPDSQQGAEAVFRRLTTQDHDGLVERVNLERQLVPSLASSCRKFVAGYTVKKEYFSAEFSAGIENITYDSIEGLHSPMFIRTVKLKDFPWNGWLTLGIDGRPTAAWNPIAGMNDPFGRLMWFAVGDPALLPSPYEAGWMLNRIADVQSNTGQ